jgi:HSP20 family protein
MMRTLQWDPFQDLHSAQDQLHQMWRAAGSGRDQPADTAGMPAWAPAVDISERKDAYLVTVELPGVGADDLDITLEEGLLTIQGERHTTHDASDQQFHRVERRYGTFRRSITLPAHVVGDAIEASMADGVLELVVPKREEAKPKRITVRPSEGKGALTVGAEGGTRG